MNHREVEREENTIDFKKVLGILYRNWYWFTASIAFFVTAAFLWTFFSIPIYQVETKILINDEGSTFMDPQMMISQAFSPNSYKVKKEMQVLGSYSLTSEALQKLPLEANWWYKDGFKTKLVYPPPFRISIDSTHFQNKNIILSVLSLDETRVVIDYLDVDAEKKVSDTITFGSYFESPSFRFRIK